MGSEPAYAKTALHRESRTPVARMNESGARLDVRERAGQRIVWIDKPVFTIGRRAASDLRLTSSDISKDHAEIARVGGNYLVRDPRSRFGTFVQGERITERALRHGDRIELGRSGGAELTFLLGDERNESDSRSTITGNLVDIAQWFDALRNTGSGRVVDDVLTLVLDHAIEATGAERAFIMLGNEAGRLEMKAARAAGKMALPLTNVAIGRKIPEEVFATGRAAIVTDLADRDVMNGHEETVAFGIRNVLCTPLRLVPCVNRGDAPAPARTIGVLYLDSQRRGRLLSQATRRALDTLAYEAAAAIESARLHHEGLDKARLDQELRTAAAIQQALLPPPRKTRGFFEADGRSIPCRAVGGDFYDFIDLPDRRFGFALGDVSGKGPPAALLTAVIQGIVSALATVAGDVSDTASRTNRALCARGLEARFATAFFGSLAPDGCLTYCNAGHNFPFLLTSQGMQRLETGGCPLGLFQDAAYEQASVRLSPGDTLVVFSDGVSEAVNDRGDDFGDERILEILLSCLGKPPRAVTDALVDAVRDFRGSICQHDDITAVVVRYGV